MARHVVHTSFALERFGDVAPSSFEAWASTESRFSREDKFKYGVGHIWLSCPPSFVSLLLITSFTRIPMELQLPRHGHSIA